MTAEKTPRRVSKTHLANSCCRLHIKLEFQNVFPPPSFVGNSINKVRITRYKCVRVPDMITSTSSAKLTKMDSSGLFWYLSEFFASGARALLWGGKGYVGEPLRLVFTMTRSTGLDF